MTGFKYDYHTATFKYLVTGSTSYLCSVNISENHNRDLGHENQQEDDDKLWIEFQDMNGTAETLSNYICIPTKRFS